MAAIESAKIAAALKKKGFRLNENDHEFWFFYYENRKTSIFSNISHGSGFKDYGDSLIKKVYTQLHLDKNQLISFVECKIDEAAYIEIMKQKGFLPSK